MDERADGRATAADEHRDHREHALYDHQDSEDEAACDAGGRAGDTAGDDGPETVLCRPGVCGTGHGESLPVELRLLMASLSALCRHGPMGSSAG